MKLVVVVQGASWPPTRKIPRLGQTQKMLGIIRHGRLGCSNARQLEKVFVEEVRVSSCGRLAHLKHYDYNGLA